MEEWKTVEIKEICTGIFEGPHATPKESSVGGYYLGIPAIGSDGHINFENAKRISEDDLPAWTKRVVPQEDDIVFTNEATLNLYAIIPAGFHGCLGRRLGLIRPNKDLVNVRYLFYYFFSPEWRCVIEKNKVYGATVERILMTKFPHFPVRLPGRETQDRIANILSCIDEKITLNTRINHNLEEQAQALYKSWFVDFEPFKGGKFVDSELGMIPEGWHVGTLSELLEVRYGKDHKALKDGNTPVFGSGGLMRYAERALYNGESVLIPRKGTLNNVMYFNGPFWTVDTMFYTVERSSNVIKYCHLFLLTQDLASMNAGSAVPSMTTDILNNLPLLIPSSQVLEAFNRVLSSIYEARSQREEESNSLSQSRDTILPQLMSGALTNTLLTC
jgi:type I restriction enzyme S subunit